MFKWFNKKPAKIKKHVPTLHGYNLDEWEFLGITEVSYIDENKDVVASCEVFFFMKKNDPDWREIKISHKSKWADFQTHPFVRLRAELWKANQLKIHESIAIPSDYLRAYMKDVYSFEWSKEKKWWVASGNTKYEKAQKDQTKTIENINNVVKVNFKKGQDND